MDARETFEGLLAEFNAASGLKAELDEQNAAVLEFGDVILNLQLLPESGQVLAWSTLGFLGDDENADIRLARLLQLNDHLGENGGFAFSFDPDDTDRVLVHDFRPLGFLANADVLATWIEALVDLVEQTRVMLDAECPYVDDADLEPLFREVK